MKWMKRTAALLMPLLLALSAVQAKEPHKARLQEEWAPYSATAASQSFSELPVLVLEEKTELWPSQGFPELPVLVLEGKAGTAAPQSLSASPAAAPEAAAAEPDGPRFPEGEDWQLLLVNPWNEIPEDYQAPRLKTLANGLKVDERIYDDLAAMIGACRNAGLSPYICSAYRTTATQTRLYNNKIARLQSAGYGRQAAIKEAGRWVARPGTSEHQLGLALDIVSSSYQALTKKQEQTPVQKWLMEHCWEYGFILRYPNDKSEITGIGYEPWHYRYVGADIALDVRDSGLCFEEYLLLRQETLAAKNG